MYKSVKGFSFNLLWSGVSTVSQTVMHRLSKALHCDSDKNKHKMHGLTRILV